MVRDENKAVMYQRMAAHAFELSEFQRYVGGNLPDAVALMDQARWYYSVARHYAGVENLRDNA